MGAIVLKSRDKFKMGFLLCEGICRVVHAWNKTCACNRPIAGVFEASKNYFR